MNLLADTQALIWFGSGHRSLSKPARQALSDPANRVYVSVISHWEIELKQGRHKEFRLDETIADIMARARFESLDLVFAVPGLLSALPWIHKDPYDRILVAQALNHDLTLVTSDGKIPLYPVKTLW